MSVQNFKILEAVAPEKSSTNKSFIGEKEKMNK